MLEEFEVDSDPADGAAAYGTVLAVYPLPPTPEPWMADHATVVAAEAPPDLPAPRPMGSRDVLQIPTSGASSWPRRSRTSATG